VKLLRRTRRAGLLLAAATALLAVPATAATAATASPATASQAADSQAAGSQAGTAATGWIRLAHLSPDTPAMDVYLYSYSNPDTRVVLRHVSYGNVSSYQTVPAGDYSVAMRRAGSAANSTPVLSGSTWVHTGAAYTAAAVGPTSSLRLQVIKDDLTTPAGKALVRVVQASLKQPKVTVSWDGKVIARTLAFPAATSYQAVAPGRETVAVTASGDDPTSSVTLTAGSIHTLVVLDGAKGLEIADLTDAQGSSTMPAGGAATGFGGTAARGPGSPLPWLAVIGAGTLLALAGGLARGRGLRRRRSGGRPLPSQSGRRPRSARA
jgi:hypothetical protein